MSEFEDLHNASIGELTEPISAERGELYGNKEAHAVGGIPPDMQASGGALASGRAFSPANEQGTVTSVFDTRPTNAQDFFVTGKDTMSYGTGFFVPKPLASISHIIPSGYAGILRGFSYHSLKNYIIPDFFEGAYGDPPIYATILINNNPLPGYSNLNLGLYTNGIIPLHAMVGENGKITLQLYGTEYFLSKILAPNINIIPNKFYMTMNGQHLKSRGLSVEFENTSPK